MATERPHCLVVGVGVGTGLACVRRFVEGGYKVSMIARHEERLQSFAEEIEHSAAYAADIAELDGYRAALRKIVADQGLPKKVIYNAALATFAPYTELDTDLFERNFRVNTTGLLVTAQELAPQMVAAGDGALIVTGNTGATRGTPRFVGFSPTKASQRILAESLARELGPQGLHIAYVVIDAMIDMPMVRQRLTDKPDDFFAKPEDIAGEVFHTAHQPPSTRSFLVEIRPYAEPW
ncbi:MAG: SDR family NAD(P)-dependent oxidoreductase [Alphaproteobacteria bacterium]|jgi:NAD(P)-dependent dehydrogenase (short-subunit alcohol dehydrogenase family)|nr:SDR family NAD(P)-dependent oxidoreductase [Alphaproteobacteria bacterium]